MKEQTKRGAQRNYCCTYWSTHTQKKQKSKQEDSDRSNMTNLANTTKAEEGRVEQIAIRSVGGIKQISVSGCTAASLTE